MPLLKDCPAGSRVYIHKYVDGVIADSYAGDVLCHDQNHALVGWKYGEHKPAGIWSKDSLSFGDSNTVKHMTNYQFGYWYSELMPIDVISMPIGMGRQVSAGMACACCKNFNHYAEPNLSDNRYGCYSCRSGGRIK